MNRNKILKLGTLFVMAIISVRLFYIQIIEHGTWVEKAAAQQTLQNVLKAERGEIYMLDGEEPVAVAMNATVYTVIIDPMIANRETIEQKLTEILGPKRVAEWDEVFSDKTRRYYIIGKNVERRAAEQVAEADFTGVWLQASTKRIYPEGTLAANVLGFVNADGLGQYGVEGSLNETLAGTDGFLKTVKDVNNVALSIGEDNIRTPAINGESVVLTIDKNIQFNVEKILTKKSKELGFENVSAVVMDPNNGKIIAMANIPSYDPADYGNVNSAEDYINHVVEDPYEPASVCKTFTFATGIDKGVMTPDKTFYNTGEIIIDDWPIRNAEQGAFLLGAQSMQTAFNYSLNTGSTQVLRWLGGSETEITTAARETLYDYYYRHFGLGQATGIELIESEGFLAGPTSLDFGINSTYANMTFGQNMQVTMIQVAAAMASLVNGGEYYTPTIVAGKMNGDDFEPNEPQSAVRRTVSESTSSTIREMLAGTRRAWRTNGLDAPGYYVGGKTGTAQVIKNGSYSFDETVATYIGVGGTEGEKPAYLIMVKIWQAGKKAEGQDHALPVFNDLKNYIQDALRIKPRKTSD